MTRAEQRPMRTQWNAQEEAALLGLPLLARVLYLQGLRRHMDYATGLVGATRRISYQGLREVAFVEPGPGRQGAGSPSLKAIRVAIEQLIRAGLVASRGSDKQLIFLCPLADVEHSTQKQQGSNRAGTGQTHQGTDFSNESNALTEQRGSNRADPNSAEQGNPQETGIREGDLFHKSVEFAGANGDDAAQDPVRALFDYWRRAMDHPRAKLDDKRRRAIAARLKDGYRVEDLKRAIDGCLASPWHQGQNGNRRTYDDIELICRNASKVDQFIAIAGTQDSEQRKLADWLDADQIIEGECHHVR